MTTEPIGAQPAEIDRTNDSVRSHLAVVAEPLDEAAGSKKTLPWTKRFARIPAEVAELDNHLIVALTILYGLANNTLCRVFIAPEYLCTALGYSQDYVRGDLRRNLGETGFVEDWDLTYHAQAGAYWWAIQLKAVPDDDFLKVMWWWLFEDPAERGGNRWMRTVDTAGQPWSNQRPALAAALAVQRYGRAESGVRHSVTDKYGTKGLGKAVARNERTVQRGFREASDRGWIGVSNRRGGRARQAKRWVRWMPEYAETREPGPDGDPGNTKRAQARWKKTCETTATPFDLGLPDGWLDAPEPPY